MSNPSRVRGVQEALDRFRPTRRTSIETIALDDALGRVPASDVVASAALPGFARSAVDGYAVVAADTTIATVTRPASLEMVGTVRMGEPPAEPLRRGTALSVSTGGALPAGADAVVMVEDTDARSVDQVQVSRAATPGQHVVGEDDDFAAGAVIAKAGYPIGVREVAALSAAGRVRIDVWRRPRVAIISTGDEVVPADTATLDPGQVRDAIGPAIAALVRAAYGEPVRHGIVPDDEQALEAACRAALADCDVLVLSAGSSVGERDLTARVVERLGPPGVWCHGLALRPGRPTLLADVGGIPVIGLPGNPLSALVVFELVGCPIVRRVGGFASEPARPTARAVLARDVPSAAGRLDVVQVRLADGRADPLPKGSALLSTLVRADGHIVVPEERDAMDAGEHVEVPAVTRVALGLLAVAAALTAPCAAHAYVIAGAPWPGGYVPYHVDAPALRSAVHAAAARWNASGARVRLVDVAVSKAAIRIRRLSPGPCQGVVGRAPVGREAGRFGIVALQASCGPLGLIPIAAHELGHVLGFGHDARLCSVMSPDEGDRPSACGGPGALPWEYDCQVLEPTDIAGAVRLYGGRPRPARAGFPFCPLLPTPPPATQARALAFPASSLATTSIHWNVAPAASLRHVLVNRAASACPSYPSVPGVSPIEVRPAVKPRRGDTIAYLPARTGDQSLLDVARLEPGRWCYSVWTIGPSHRYTRAATAFVRIGPRPDLATRLGLTATAALTPGLVAGSGVPEVSLGFHLPASPPVDAVRIERIPGACPAPDTTIDGQLVGEPPPTPGAVSVTDTSGLTAGAWCYAVEIQLADRDLDPALVQVEVAAPTP